MGRTMRVLGRWAREFAAGVDAGNAVRLGLPYAAVPTVSSRRRRNPANRGEA
jgi:hypothetical protein